MFFTTLLIISETGLWSLPFVLFQGLLVTLQALWLFPLAQKDKHLKYYHQIR
jgi:hypothetical protein